MSEKNVDPKDPKIVDVIVVDPKKTGEETAATITPLTAEQIEAIVEKHLKETRPTPRNMLLSRIVQRHLVEAKGTATDPLDTGTDEEMAKAVWEQGYPALRDVFADMIMLPKGKLQWTVPVPALGTALTAEPATTDVTFIGMSYKVINADQVRGVNYGWVRAYLENAAWDGIQPQLKEAGRVIEQSVFDYIYAALLAGVDAGNLDATEWANAAAFSYDEFVKGLALLAADDYVGDVCLLDPNAYFELLKDQKFIDASYIGNDSPIKTGRIQTTLGCSVFMSSRCTDGKAVFLQTSKAIAIAVRRATKVEEYAYPDDDLYGFVATMKFGATVILPKAIAVLHEAAA